MLNIENSVNYIKRYGRDVSYQMAALAQYNFEIWKPTSYVEEANFCPSFLLFQLTISEYNRADKLSVYYYVQHVLIIISILYDYLEKWLFVMNWIYSRVTKLKRALQLDVKRCVFSHTKVVVSFNICIGS